MRRHGRVFALLATVALAGCASDPVTVEGPPAVVDWGTPTATATAIATPAVTPSVTAKVEAAPAQPLATPTATPTQTQTPTAVAAPASRWLTADQRRRADQFVSAFENSTTTIDYAYAENINDNAGVTTGRAGFTTRTCDALTLVKHYGQSRPDNGLVRFLPELQRLCDTNSASTSGLPEAEYMAAWRTAAADPQFRAAQDWLVDQEYFNPAMQEADRVGVTSALTRAEIYDSAVHQGAGGMKRTVQATVAKVGSPAQVGEAAWLDAFLTVRSDILRGTGGKKAGTTDRVESIRRVASTGNLALNGPITFSVYGDTFTIS